MTNMILASTAALFIGGATMFGGFNLHAKSAVNCCCGDVCACDPCTCDCGDTCDCGCCCDCCSK